MHWWVISYDTNGREEGLLIDEEGRKDKAVRKELGDSFVGEHTRYVCLYLQLISDILQL